MRETLPKVSLNPDRLVSASVKVHTKCYGAMGRNRLITTITTSLKTIYQDHNFAIIGNLPRHLEPKDRPVIFFLSNPVYPGYFP